MVEIVVGIAVAEVGTVAGTVAVVGAVSESVL